MCEKEPKKLMSPEFLSMIFVFCHLTLLTLGILSLASIGHRQPGMQLAAQWQLILDILHLCYLYIEFIILLTQLHAFGA